MKKSKNLSLLCACSVMLASLFITSCIFPTEEQKIAEEISKITELTTPNEWYHGRFTSDSQVKRYTLQVTRGNRYFIYLNDSEDGDKSKTADVGMKIYHIDGTKICENYNYASKCYTSPFSFSASGNGVVTIEVASYANYNWENGTGTYAIKYTSRKEVFQLEEGIWKDDIILSSGQTNKYTIQATGKTRYFIYLDDIDSGSAGNNKTADMGLKILHSDGTYICKEYSGVDKCFANPFTFVTTNREEITIIAASHANYNWENGTGTYAIKYASRPEYDELPVDEDGWVDDSIIANGQINKYKLSVTKKTRYFIYLDDIDAGSAGNNKTADMGLKILYSDGTVISKDYHDADKCFATPYTFVATNNDVITIIAASYTNYNWENGTGTYAIRCTSRSEYDELPPDEWVNDKIISNGQVNKYTIDVTEGKTYSIYLNDIDAGTSTSKTADMGLKIFYDSSSNVDNPYICDQYSKADNCYSTPYTFTAPSDGTIVIVAASYANYNWETGTGTYAIKYTVAE